MTLAMDALLVSSKARIGCVLGRAGNVPETASSWFLPRIVGLPTALDLVENWDPGFTGTASRKPACYDEWIRG